MSENINALSQALNTPSQVLDTQPLDILSKALDTLKEGDIFTFTTDEFKYYAQCFLFDRPALLIRNVKNNKKYLYTLKQKVLDEVLGNAWITPFVAISWVDYYLSGNGNDFMDVNDIEEYLRFEDINNMGYREIIKKLKEKAEKFGFKRCSEEEFNEVVFNGYFENKEGIM